MEKIIITSEAFSEDSHKELIDIWKASGRELKVQFLNSKNKWITSEYPS